jgi:hypothetical protein
MKTLSGVGVASLLVLAYGIAFGQAHVSNDPSQEIIKALVDHLPKGVKTGKQLPPFVKEAVKELASLSSNRVEVEALCARLVVITDMDRYLDYIRVTDPRLRDLIKRRYAAFTINQQWPIYINGESNLYKIGQEIAERGAENPVVHKLAAVLWHEIVHAEGQADEAIAISEEIKMLERLLRRGLVELDWVSDRRAQLVDMRKGQISVGALIVTTSKP